MIGNVSRTTNALVGDLPARPTAAGPPPAPPPSPAPSDGIEVEGRTRPAGGPSTGAPSAAGAKGATGAAKAGANAGPTAKAVPAQEQGRHAPGVWEVAGRFFSGLLGVLGGALVAGAKAVFGLFHSSRGLDDGPKSMLRKQFGPALNVDKIRVVTNAPFLKGTDTRAVTVGNTIYFQAGAFSDSLLVHEATHVLQYQATGPGYAVRALAGQASRAGYNFAAGYVNGTTHFEDLNPEQQAALLETIHATDFESKPRGERRLYSNPAEYETSTSDPAEAARDPAFVDVTALAEDALVKSRQRRGLLPRPGAGPAPLRTGGARAGAPTRPDAPRRMPPRTAPGVQRVPAMGSTMRGGPNRPALGRGNVPSNRRVKASERRSAPRASATPKT